jgi:ribosomal-protein-alanine N-acetyltransferase
MPAVLETPRLLLRPWSLDDAEAAFAIYSDPEVMRFLSGVTHRSVDETRTVIASRGMAHHALHGFSLWATVEKETGRLLGCCGLKFLDGGMDVEVGYHFARAAWGRGYATEGAAASVRYGFERLGLPCILGVVDPLNFASQRVLEKVGLTYRGMGRYYNTDVKVYSVARPGGIPTA